MNLISLIKERAEYPINRTTDQYIENLLSSSPDSSFLITTDAIFRANSDRILKNYKINGLFDLCNCYDGSFIKFTLFQLEKIQNRIIKTSIYGDTELITFLPISFNFEKSKWVFYSVNPKNSSVSEFGDRSGDIIMNKLPVPQKYPDEYIEYLEKITKWIECNIKPNDNHFNEFLFSQLDYRFLFPSKYTKETIQIESLIKKEESKPLQEIADFFPQENTNKIDDSYIDFNKIGESNDIKKGTVYNIQLKEGDILHDYFNSFKIVDFTLPTPLFLPTNCLLIRPKINSFYLYAYLTSSIFRVLSLNSGIGLFHDLSIQELKSLPVIIPNKEDSYYEDAYKFTHLKKYEEDTIDDLYKVYFNNEIPNNKFLSSTSLLHSESIEKLHKIKNQKAKDAILEDVHEIKHCINAKAYKASIIMIGSVLEAFLIDWLSEIHSKNYFIYDFPAYDQKGNSRKAGLFDYINSINNIKKPSWAGYLGAEEIRDKRNWVHAKVFLKKGILLDERLCLEMLNYLIDIINTRWPGTTTI